MKLWFSIFSAVLLAVAAGGKEIKGQVFVVTQAGTSIKLALAKVYVVSPSGVEKANSENSVRLKEVNGWAAEQQAAFEKDRKQYESMGDTIYKSEFLETLSKNFRAFSDAYAEKVKCAGSEPPSGLPSETITDADGMFTLDAPADAVILIHASRGQPREIYRWVLPVADLAPASDKVLFSNHNMYEPGKPAE